VKAPVIPVVQFPDGSWHNDSTPLIYSLEAADSARSIVPEDSGQAFLAHLIEDFADEWLTKAMFGWRWLAQADQEQMSRWLAFDAFKGSGLDRSLGHAAMFRDRQVGRMAIVGCTAENFPLIERSARDVLAALEGLVVDRHCLFGTRPSLAEFGLFGQISQFGVDPTPQAIMRADYPYTYRWLEHVDDMSGVEGEWDAPEAALPDAVASILKVIGSVYLPFLIANAKALAAGEESVRLTALGHDYRQGVFKYQAKCLVDLRASYAALPDAARVRIEPLLADAGCLEPMVTS
jgi:glutathione S-transferase